MRTFDEFTFSHHYTPNHIELFQNIMTQGSKRRKYNISFSNPIT